MADRQRDSCLLCPHVVVAGLVCFDDPWGYAIEPLMPDKVRLRTKRDTAVRFRNASALWTCLCKRTSDSVTPEEDRKLESATGTDIGPTVYLGRGNRVNEIRADLATGAIEGSDGVFSQTKSDTVFR